ncbi:hypothetical protein BC832DRAFT_550309 [Gaertneriomyces semiglobifer]|nr:hypothetical protein BC832DRAFT_550309 [Gaertneriomyces semiglobifer]
MGQCGTDGIEQKLDRTGGSPTEHEVYDFDLVYPSLSNPTVPTIFLYADILSADFPSTHGQLMHLAEDGRIQYVLRYLKPKVLEGRGPLYVSGYGVELMVKSTEYVATDDRLHEADATDTSGEEKVKSNSTDGILYEFPPRLVKLEEKSKKGLGLKLSHHIMTSASPFDVLYQASLNLPKLVHLIADLPMDVAGDLRSEAATNQLLLQRSQGFWINGRELDSTSLDFFGVLRVLREEESTLRPLLEVGLTGEEAVDLLTAPLGDDIRVSPNPWMDIFDVRFDHIVWMNDLERDARYKGWPRDIQDVLRPTPSNQLQYLAKNMVSLLFEIDFANPQQLFVVKQAMEFIERSLPFRIGIVPVAGAEPNDTSSLACLAFHQAIAQKGRKAARNLIFSWLQVGELTPAAIESTFKQHLGVAIDSESKAAQSLIAATSGFMERTGWVNGASTGALFVNGRQLRLSRTWQQELLSVYFPIIQFIQKGVHQKIITHSTNIWDYFMTLDGVWPKSVPEVFGNVQLMDLTSLNDTFHGAIEWVEGEGRPISVVHIGDRNYAEKSDDPRVRTGFLPKALNGLLGLSEDDNALLVNGRLVTLEKPFTSEDMNILVQFESAKRLGTTTQMLQSFLQERLNGHELSNAIWKLSSYVVVTREYETQKTEHDGASARTPSRVFANLGIRHSLITVPTKSSPQYQIFAVINPLGANQKLLSILHSLRAIPGVDIGVLLLPNTMGIEQIPERFYTYLASDPAFDESGKIVEPRAVFDDIPIEGLYVLGLDVPRSWMALPYRSQYDLDNLKVGANVKAEFFLENILLEGHATDVTTGGPPRGLQWILGNELNESMYDTITMANLGYFQLKAGFGVWTLRTRPGRSRDVFEVASAQNGALLDKENGAGVRVSITSWEGTTLYVTVGRTPGMERTDVLDFDEGDGKAVWKTVRDWFGVQKAAETINIFSVASGHLYERFLGIMMLSVKKQTKNPVKFWLIKNFLSPEFIDFLPHLAESYDFSYEYVTYKWPSFLRAQTEKQRIIWGYKILFLDVLFPLSLQKVIFVDADQIVRADLLELQTLDLKDNVYGYTPFCDDRPEVDGFRFWKNGWWKEQLGGKPYHISALYVVDLQRFRQMAAGDRLRQQYQALSADPNSLANLDQDLPNYMNREGGLGIFSLPQEWLWCETWCSDESKQQARTIDLCNNPLTKEPKLARAKRILPEWVGYDQEVEAVRKRWRERSKPKPVQPSRSELNKDSRDEL